MAITKTARRMIAAAQGLRESVDKLTFAEPVHYVYNPLDYAWEAHVRYLEKYARSPVRVVFLGMNPGPWGMAQTGVPFGEVEVVRDWLKIDAVIGKPKREHPKRPVQGLDCKRSEVSGRRLWGLFAERFGDAEDFFKDHFVANYCPLVFMEESARNRTPDKLPAAEREPLEQACDRHLATVLEILGPRVVVGVGAYAERQAQRVTGAMPEAHAPRTARILHPSPASPKANHGWAGQATRELRKLGVWD